MLLIKTLWSCIIFLQLLWANPIYAHELTDFLADLSSMSADFKQYVYSNDGELLASSAGYVLFQRPQQLVWRTTSPDQQSLWLKSDQAWLVDYDLEQAIQQDIAQIDSSPLAWLLKTPEQATTKDYWQYTQTQDGISWYQSAHNSNFKLGLKNQQLHTISMQNQLDQQILIVFSELKINPEISADALLLTLDPEFDVIF
jgi:outer membrane lipoprotein carrier protein